MVLKKTWAAFQVPPFSIPGSHSSKEQKVQDVSSASSRVGGIKLFQRVASRRLDAKTHADSFGQVPMYTANQSSGHLSVKSGGRLNGGLCLALDNSVQRQVLLPGSDGVKMGLTVGLDVTVLLCTWSNLTAEPLHGYCGGGGQLSEFLLQSLQNPVNLATQSAVAKTASDVPYLLTE
ncbi:hypothetical protein F2P79_018241 [Pimephales promelas]|nr:hypothetical protein F2P79_018241 [Pimephales promelas]